MSFQFEEAFEAGDAGLLLGNEEDGFVGIFFGDVSPETDVPEAPQGSLFIRRTDGKVFSRSGFTGNGVPSDWIEGTGGSVSSSAQVPFCLADGTPDNIPLVLGDLPFCLADGSSSSIPIV